MLSMRSIALLPSSCKVCDTPRCIAMQPVHAPVRTTPTSRALEPHAAESAQPLSLSFMCKPGHIHPRRPRGPFLDLKCKLQHASCEAVCPPSARNTPPSSCSALEHAGACTAILAGGAPAGAPSCSPLLH